MSRSALVLVVGLVGCGGVTEISTSSDGNDTSSSSDATPTSSTPGDSSSGAPADTSSSGDAPTTESTGVAAGCGDGMRTGLEQCDDGNDTPDDGCEPGCLLPSGEQVWAVEVDAGDDDVAHDLLVTDDGVILVVGSRRGDAGLDTWLARYDAAGELLDELVVDLGEGDDDEGLAVASLGLGYVLAGYASPAGIDDADDALLVALDGEFGVVWSQRIDGGLDDRGNDVSVTQSAIAIAGSREDAATYEDAWFAVYDTSGAEQWSLVDDGPGSRNDVANGVAWLADGGLAVVGSEAIDSQDDLWMTVREADGGLRWEQRLDFEFGDDVASAVIADGDDLLVSGSISSALTNSEEVWVARFSADGSPGTVISYNSPGFVFDGAEDAIVDGDAVFVAGISAAAEQQRNAMVGRFPIAGGEPVWRQAFDGGPGLADAAHAIAVLSDGSVVATGEVTVLGQGTNAWIRRWAR